MAFEMARNFLLQVPIELARANYPADARQKDAQSAHDTSRLSGAIGGQSTALAVGRQLVWPAPPVCYRRLVQQEAPSETARVVTAL